MSLLISHIHEQDYSRKIKHNKFFYAYTFFLGSFAILQIYTLHFSYNHSFSYDEIGEVVFENININNTDIIFTKDLYLRNIKPKLHYIVTDYKTVAFEIIQKDLHCSLFVNLFTLVTVIYVYNNYNSIFLKWILQDQFSVERNNFIQYIALASYIINVTCSIFINKISTINNFDINMETIDFFAKYIYRYYCLKYTSFYIFISICIGAFITILVYRYILKNIKRLLQKTN